MREGLAPGTQIVVENKTGSGGKIAVDALRASPADGGTLLLAPLVTLMPSQLTFKNPGYNPATDMTPIGVVGHFQFALTVPPNHPAKNIAEFVTRLKANKKKPTAAAPAPAACRTFLASCSAARLTWTWCMWPTKAARRC